MTAFCLIKHAQHIWKIDKVLGIRIQSIYKTRTRNKPSIKALLFFYLKIGSFQVFKHFEGFRQLSKNCLSSPYENGKFCVVLRDENASWYVRYGGKTGTVQKCVASTIIISKKISGQLRFTQVKCKSSRLSLLKFA